MTEPLADVIRELRELLAKATPGPWVADYTNLYDREDCQDLMTSSCCCGNGRMKERHDASLIAATVNHLPQLLAAAEKAEQLEVALQAALDKLGDLSKAVGCAEEDANRYEKALREIAEKVCPKCWASAIAKQALAPEQPAQDTQSGDKHTQSGYCLTCLDSGIDPESYHAPHPWPCPDCVGKKR